MVLIGVFKASPS